MTLPTRTHTIDDGTLASSSPNTFSFDSGTRAGSNDVMIVYVAWENSGTDGNEATITYDGDSMTQIGTTSSPPTTAGYSFGEYMSVWRLDDPSAGTNDFSVSLDDDGQDLGIWGAIYQDVDSLGTPVQDDDFDGPAVEDISVSFTKAQTDSVVVVGAVKNNQAASPWVPATDNTEVIDNTLGTTANNGFAYFLNEITDSSGSYTAGSTADDSNGAFNPASILAVELIGVTSGSIVVPRRRIEGYN